MIAERAWRTIASRWDRKFKKKTPQRDKSRSRKLNQVEELRQDIGQHGDNGRSLTRATQVARGLYRMWGGRRFHASRKVCTLVGA